MGIDEVKKLKKSRNIAICSLVVFVVLLAIILLTSLFVGTSTAFKTHKGILKPVKSERLEKNANDKIEIKKEDFTYQDHKYREVKTKVWSITTNKFVSNLDEKFNPSITEDSMLKILHITDIHFGAGVLSISNDKKTMDAVTNMVMWSKPDMIIVTGDAIYPVPITSGTLNNGRSAENFASLMDSFKIPWAFVYGNHDTESYATETKEQVSKIFQQHEYNGENKFCLYQEGLKDFSKVEGGEPPLGNYPILIRNKSDNKLKHVLMFMDSNKYNKNSEGPNIFWKYDNIHEDQALWYKKVLTKLSLDNGYTAANPVTSSLYFHIPIEQYKSAWIALTKNLTKEGEKQKHFDLIDPADQIAKKVKYFGGDVQEFSKDPTSVIISTSTVGAPIWDAIKELGSTKFLFCGHDHDNNFSIEYDGVRLTYGKSVDYQAYPGISKRTFQRGGSVIYLTGEQGADALKIYQKKLAMIGKDQISNMNVAATSIEDVFKDTPNPNLGNPIARLIFTGVLIFVIVVTIVVYLIVRIIIKNRKMRKIIKNSKK